MPADALDGVRIRVLRELKGLQTQQALAGLVGVPQSHVCDLEHGKLRNSTVFVRVADKIDCTTDFLFRRGRFKNAEPSEQIRHAAIRMAFDCFAARLDVTADQRARCQRVVAHPGAPMTSDGWKVLAEMIDRAIGPE